MRRTLCRAAALAGLVLGTTAVAQQPQPLLPQPRITSAFPCGAQAGTTVEITVAGTDLDEPTVLLFSHPKITGDVVVPPPPPVDPKAKPDPKKMTKKGGVPASVKFKVTVPADVPPGHYDVRISNKWGVSNPRAFVVGDRPELLELEPNNDVHDLQLERSAGGVIGGPMAVPVRDSRAQRIELGTVVHGVISTPTDVDYSVFTGKAGQRVLLNCQTSTIDSKARPLVELYDPSGRRLGLNRNYSANDALLDVTLPADGEYFIRVSEFAYQQGGPDYFYRLSVGTGPWIDAVFPPAVKAGAPTPVTLFGRNLPGGKPVAGLQVDGRPVEALTVTVTPPTGPAARTKLEFRGRIAPPMALQDGFEYRLPSPAGVSNAVPIFLTDETVTLEKEAGNDRPESAETVPTPGEIAGRIDKRYDRDYYAFTAKKGDVLFIEAVAEQVGSASDLYLRVRDEKNKDLSPELDDDQEVLHPVAFYTRNGDPPAYKFTAPADGKYLILVGSIDANVSYGPRCFYRLRVTRPVPDFRAVVMPRGKDPGAVTARPDGEVAFDVYVSRSGGFTGPVTVTAEGLPAGVTARPALVGTGTKWGTLILSTAAGAKEFTGPFSVKCSATVEGKPLVREARPATISWGVGQQQNVPTIARLDQQLMVAVRPDKATFRLTADLAAASVKTKDKAGKEQEQKLGGGPIFVKPGDKLSIPVKLAWQDPTARTNPLNVQVEPTQQNMQQAPLSVNNNQPVAIAPGKNGGVVPVDVRPNAQPGTYSLVLRGETQISFLRDPEQKDKKTNITALGFAQPIEVTVLPTSLAKLSVQPPANNQLKLGTTGELLVKVERQADYTGPFEVTVTLPADAKGVTIQKVTIPAGQDEVKLPVVVAKDAKTGGLSNVLVQATATVHGKFPVIHETKLNLNVAK